METAPAHEYDLALLLENRNRHMPNALVHTRILTQPGVIPMPNQARGAPQSRLLTLDDVAEYLNVSKDWVRDHATRRRPRIPVVRLGSKRAILRFRPSDIENFIAQNLSEGGV